ncbi:MAG: hypothetical protein PHG66_06165 [Candidatus Colwellbacteria bacterium]|nr:hypothetical protein [Candidatus Colwellbacteria bacterium]
MELLNEDLVMVLGSMCAGKSFELASYFAPLKLVNGVGWGLYQSARNTRDMNVWSRNGVELEAKKIESLEEVLKDGVAIAGIDEFHMFPESDIVYLKKILALKRQVIVSGLLTDYQGKMIGVVRAAMELGPSRVIMKRAVCSKCGSWSATYTQIEKDGVPILSGLPSVVPEDGRYRFLPVCPSCFIKK